MTLCRLLVLNFKGKLTDLSPEDYDEYDLHGAIEYCEGWIEQGETEDIIDGFKLQDLKDWCINKLKEMEE